MINWSILAKTSLKFSQSGVKTTFKQDEGMQRGEKQFWQNFYFWQAEYYCWDTSEGRSERWQNLVKQSRMMRALVDTGGRLCARNTDISPLPPFRFCISVLSFLHGPNAKSCRDISWINLYNFYLANFVLLFLILSVEKGTTLLTLKKSPFSQELKKLVHFAQPHRPPEKVTLSDH